MKQELNHQTYAAGLRELADWVEAHPEVQLPTDHLQSYIFGDRGAPSEVLHAMKPCKKEYTESYFHLIRHFGPIKLDYFFDREAVCQRVVVGKRQIEAHLRPATLIPAEMIEAHEEDVVEWRCGQALLDQPEVAAELEELAANDGASS